MESKTDPNFRSGQTAFGVGRLRLFFRIDKRGVPEKLNVFRGDSPYRRTVEKTIRKARKNYIMFDHVFTGVKKCDMSTPRIFNALIKGKKRAIINC